MDRNGLEINGVSYDVWSLSARRAWIEITVVATLATLVTVALRKESVDRNCGPQGSGKTLSMSLSARRAWIEIRGGYITKIDKDRRSPQGERG